MAVTFFWYDLETTSINPREGRIMQFAGQRTDMDLQPVGEPVNVLIKLTEDILPDPDAIMVTGITPQATLADGLTEVEFLKFFHEEIAVPDTIFAGYNTVRFDDEFMRCLHYRNFYDPYQWQWMDGRGKWDLLDVVRMTRALRPDGIEWPFTPEGVPTNRLELITKLNGVSHEHAHDALNDVLASIAVARLIRDKQPKLYDWLLNIRQKSGVEKLVTSGEPFVYASGKYPNETLKTTVVMQILKHPKRPASMVYDLRHDPTEFISLDAKQLAERWQWTRDENAPKRLPVKMLRHNCCPAVAPLGVLDETSQERLRLSLDTVKQNRAKLLAAKDFSTKIAEALEIKDGEQLERWNAPEHVDGRLYDGFLDEHDCHLLDVVRAAKPDEFAELAGDFHDGRMKEMLPLYKARNFSKFLTDDERKTWETYRYKQLMEGGQDSRLAKFMHRLQELAEGASDDKRFLLEELQLYAESIMPVFDDAA